jgi:FkbM family methyltransferase
MPMGLFERAKRRVFEEVTGYKTTRLDGYRLLHPKNTMPFDPTWSQSGYELHHRITALSGNLAVDVGGYVGAYTVRLAKRFKRVVAFEPNPANKHILLLNIKRNHLRNVTVWPIALGDRESVQRLHIPSATSGFNMASSSLDSSHQGIEFNRSYPVEVKKLDEYQLSPEFVKIDAEGAEAAILRGAPTTLHSCHPTLGIEVHHSRIGTECKCEVCSYLRSINYEIEYLGELKRENERTPAHWIWAK